MSTAAGLIKFGILASVFLTVLGLGLAATWNDATYLVRKPALLARSLFSMFVIMPIICVCAALLFHLPPPVRVALVALSISPVPPLLPQKELTAGGHSAYAISLVAIAAVLSMVYVPLITSLFAEWFHHAAAVSSGAVAKIVLTTILVPLALGMAIRAWMPSLALRTGKPVGLIGVMLVLLCCLPLAAHQLVFRGWHTVDARPDHTRRHRRRALPRRTGQLGSHGARTVDVGASSGGGDCGYDLRGCGGPARARCGGAICACRHLRHRPYVLWSKKQLVPAR